MGMAMVTAATAVMMVVGTATVVTDLLLLLLHLLLLHQHAGDVCERLHQLLQQVLLADNGLLHLLHLLLQGVQLARVLLAQLRLIAHEMSQGRRQRRGDGDGAMLLL